MVKSIAEKEEIMLNIAVVEDIKEEQDHLLKLIKEYLDEKKLVYDLNCFDNPSDFLKTYKLQYNIIFLDIIMPEINGMSLARIIRERDSSTFIIFTTSRIDYVLQGYDVEATDYLLKPVKREHLFRALDRTVKKFDQERDDEILITCEKENIKLKLSEIYYIEVRNHNITYHTTRGEYTLRSSMKEIEKEVKDKSFAKSSYSYLVNLKYVNSIKRDEVYIKDEVLPITDSFKKSFQQALIDYLKV